LTPNERVLTVGVPVYGVKFSTDWTNIGRIWAHESFGYQAHQPQVQVQVKLSENCDREKGDRQTDRQTDRQKDTQTLVIL